jgi:hypothetical protein
MYLSLGRSNIGGWHSRPDFLNRLESAVGALTTWITWAIRKMVDATAGPDRPFSGVLEFLDPRAGVEAVSALGDPYGEPFRVRPEAGLLLVFPSWLYHWVRPYAGQSPRIAVSFNVTLSIPATVKSSIAETIASSEIETSIAPRCRHNGSHVDVTTEGLDATRRLDAIPTLTLPKGGQPC